MKIEEIMTGEYYSGTRDFLILCIKIIYNNKNEFDGYKSAKLQGVKALKDYTNGGLRDCKEICDLYWSGKIPNYIIEERKIKLERLAKQPFVSELVKKIVEIKEMDLQTRLMTFEMDDLFRLDELFSEKFN